MVRPGQVVRAVAPIRVCDVGGWTDTWFAGHGTVVNIAVSPSAEVDVVVTEGDGDVLLHAADYGEEYAVVPGEDRSGSPPRHPLLEAAIDEVGVPVGLHLAVRVHCRAPAGCSTGTSAAVAVALVGALRAVGEGAAGRSPLDVARTAHRLETERLGLQSGVQDQLASATGGINHLAIGPYPEATVTPIAVPTAARRRLGERLVLVYLGRRHVSSEVHDKVIDELRGEGPGSPRLETLRRCATRARTSLAAGDLPAFGRVLQDNTDAQAALHPDLVSAQAERAIDVARSLGCAGWKVNGAGGAGGSVSLLLGDASPPVDELVDALTEADPSFRHLPTALSPRGLTVTVGPSTRPST